MESNVEDIPLFGKGLAKTPEWSILRGMKSRCSDKKMKYYYLYGGKGIKVCDEWMKDSRSFVIWARENGYKKGLQIDRIDSNKDYEPSNCRIVTSQINAINTKKPSKYPRCISPRKLKDRFSYSVRIHYNGKTTTVGCFKTVKEAVIAYNEFITKNNYPHPLNEIP